MEIEEVINGKEIFEVSENHWVIPEKLGKLECVGTEPIVYLCTDTGYGLSGTVKNSGFKVMIDSFNYIGSHSHNSSHGPIYNIYTVDSKYCIRVTIGSLIRCIQLNGINQDGTLNGTYCFIPCSLKCDYFEIIPEFTKEYEIKYDISKIYNDISISFSKKMIPGHVYITKGEKLYLCLGSSLSLNCNDTYRCYSCGGFYEQYRSKSKRVKLLYPLRNIFSNPFLFLKKNKSYQESILDGEIAGPLNFFHYNVEIFHDGFAGKDIGLFFKDDGRPFREYTKDLNLNFPLFLLDNSFRVNEIFKKFIKSLGKEEKEEYVKNNPDLRDIFTV